MFFFVAKTDLAFQIIQPLRTRPSGPAHSPLCLVLSNLGQLLTPDPNLCRPLSSCGDQISTIRADPAAQSTTETFLLKLKNKLGWIWEMAPSAGQSCFCPHRKQSAGLGSQRSAWSRTETFNGSGSGHVESPFKLQKRHSLQNEPRPLSPYFRPCISWVLQRNASQHDIDIWQMSKN